MISVDPLNWELNVQNSGTVQAPRIAQSVSFKIAATPKQCGQLLIPSCSLVLESFLSSVAAGSDGDSNVKESMKEELTGSRCFNTCEWYRAEVS